MSLLKNTHSDRTASTETTTISTCPSPYVTQTYFDTTIDNTIKYVLANFYDKHANRISKQDSRFK